MLIGHFFYQMALGSWLSALIILRFVLIIYIMIYDFDLFMPLACFILYGVLYLLIYFIEIYSVCCVFCDQCKVHKNDSKKTFKILIFHRLDISKIKKYIKQAFTSENLYRFLCFFLNHKTNIHLGK